MAHKRLWAGDEWQSFCHQLVQLRHGSQNIQCVPDAVKGDAGIEFIFIDGTLYQCYAPEEVAHTQKAAAAQKAKASKDLKKLEQYKHVVEPLLQGLMIDRWILLSPFLDDKAVVTHIRQLGLEVRAKGLPFVASDFEALIHSQEDFESEIAELRSKGAMPLNVAISSPADIAAQQGGPMGEKLMEKLQRGFGGTASRSQIEAQRDGYIRAHMSRENALEDLRLNHPALWEVARNCLVAEEQRLVAIAATSSLPSEQLQTSINNIEKSLKADLPALATSFATVVAIGTVSDWLIRCPLDFPDNGQ